jgi:CBS domain-containing protein
VKVGQLLELKGREVTTLSASQTVADAIATLREHRIGAAVVVDGSRPLAGIVSERDVVTALARMGAGALGETVGAVMTSDVVTCQESDTVTNLMVTMTENRIRHLPVVEHGRLVGIISIGDVVKVRLAELEGEKKELLDYVSSW